MGIPRKGVQCFVVIYSNIIALNTNIFTKYLKTHLRKHIHTKRNTRKSFQVFPKAIKHQLTCLLRLTLGSFLSGRNCILVIPINHLFRPGLHDIGLLFMLDRFPEFGTKTLRSMSVNTKPRKQPSDTISCQNNYITSTIFVVFFAYLLSNLSTSFALKPSYYQSEVWERFISITMFRPTTN